jgi:hypothetical protein
VAAAKRLWWRERMSFSNDGPSNPQKSETRLVTAGRDSKAQKGFVNPPVFHGSTVLYPTAEDLHAHRGAFTYGRHGTPTTRALQDVLMSLEGPQCAGVGLAPSGLAAITTTLLSVLNAGDHLLVTDNVYRPSAISATACSPATASRPPISIPWSAPGSKNCSSPTPERCWSRRQARNPLK